MQSQTEAFGKQVLNNGEGQMDFFHVWRKKGAAFDEKSTSPSMGVDLLCFGVMWQLKANIAHVDGRMDSTKYQQILTTNVTQSRSGS